MKMYYKILGNKNKLKKLDVHIMMDHIKAG